MSDVLIKNIQIPKDNKRLALFIDKDGEVTVFDGNEFVRITDAIEVPTHGRLGNLDKVAGRMHNHSKSCRENGNIEKAEIWEHAELEVRLQGTVIEASN